MECTICLGPVICKIFATVPECAHSYHIDCIRQWARVKSFCPLCKSPFSALLIHNHRLSVQKLCNAKLIFDENDDEKSSEEIVHNNINKPENLKRTSLNLRCRNCTLKMKISGLKSTSTSWCCQVCSHINYLNYDYGTDVVTQSSKNISHVLSLQSQMLENAKKNFNHKLNSSSSFIIPPRLNYDTKLLSMAWNDMKTAQSQLLSNNNNQQQQWQHNNNEINQSISNHSSIDTINKSSMTYKRKKSNTLKSNSSLLLNIEEWNNNKKNKKGNYSIDNSNISNNILSSHNPINMESASQYNAYHHNIRHLSSTSQTQIRYKRPRTAIHTSKAPVDKKSEANSDACNAVSSQNLK